MKRFSSKDLLSLTQDEYSRVYRHFLANAIYHLPPDQIELDIRDEILIQISESTASWLHTSFDFHLLELGIETGLNTATKTPDPVHHPSHYTTGHVEAIEAIEAALGQSGFEAFLRGQVMKYIWRLPHKSTPKQDAEKARWYLDKLIQCLSPVTTIQGEALTDHSTKESQSK